MSTVEAPSIGIEPAATASDPDGYMPPVETATPEGSLGGAAEGVPPYTSLQRGSSEKRGGQSFASYFLIDPLITETIGLTGLMLSIHWQIPYPIVPGPFSFFFFQETVYNKYKFSHSVGLQAVFCCQTPTVSTLKEYFQHCEQFLSIKSQ